MVVESHFRAAIWEIGCILGGSEHVRRHSRDISHFTLATINSIRSNSTYSGSRTSSMSPWPAAASEVQVLERLLQPNARH